MRRFNRRHEPGVCRGCGIALGKNGGWECSVCYWTGRMARQQPIEELRKRHFDIRVRLEALPKEIEGLKQVLLQYREALKRRAHWWRKLTGTWIDGTLRSYQERKFILEAELSKLEREDSSLERTIKEAEYAKKRFREAKRGRKVADAQKRAEAEKHENFCNSSIKNLQAEFDRKNFHIRPEDYRRGNPIDNHFHKIENTVFGAFNHCCVFCGASDDLTFDHYALSKNEGGNFVLIMADKTSVRLNIVVLCRSCNASKAQTGHLLHFDDAQRERAESCQHALLAHLLRDSQFLKLIKKWSR
jgi:hypothetical protein